MSDGLMAGRGVIGIGITLGELSPRLAPTAAGDRVIAFEPDWEQPSPEAWAHAKAAVT
ncbi:MAG: hypothetical protein JJU40_14605 [Rhodobacteraceae bacterium]|nr:hypothetical protein [Paracoccaceae bacterium]